MAVLHPDLPPPPAQLFLLHLLVSLNELHIFILKLIVLLGFYYDMINLQYLLIG